MLMPQIINIPERDLIAAVLHRAIMDATSDGAAYNYEHNQEARRFLHLNCEPALIDILLPRPFSFIWICQCLDLDWRSFRRAIKSQLFVEPCVELPPAVIHSHDTKPTSMDNSYPSSQTSQKNP